MERKVILLMLLLSAVAETLVAQRIKEKQPKKQNDGSPVAREIVTVKAGIPFSKELDS